MALHIFCCYLQPVAIAAGVDSNSSDLFIPLLGVGSVCGLLISGFLSDLGCYYHPVEITAVTILCSATLAAVITIKTQFGMFSLFGCFLLGFFTSYWTAATNHILVSLIGLNQFTSALGLLFAVRSIGTLVVPLTVNIVRLVVGDDESNVLFLASILFAVSCLLYAATACFIHRHSDIISEEDEILEWDNAGEEWDQDEYKCDLEEEEQCQPCDSPCLIESGRRTVRSEVGESCLLSCEETCQPCDDEECEETCQPCEEEEQEKKNRRSNVIKSSE